MLLLLAGIVPGIKVDTGLTVSFCLLATLIL